MKKIIILMLAMFVLTTQVLAADNIRYKTKANGDTYVYKNGVLTKRYHNTSGGRTVVYNSEGQVIRSFSRSANGTTRVYNSHGEQIARVRGNSDYTRQKTYGYRSPYQYHRRGIGRDPRSISDNHSISNIRSVSDIRPVQPIPTFTRTTFVKF